MPRTIRPGPCPVSRRRSGAKSRRAWRANWGARFTRNCAGRAHWPSKRTLDVPTGSAAPVRSLETAFWTSLTMSSGCFHGPASGRRCQAQRVCQDNNITMDNWTRRREKILQEHRKDGAREQLTASWETWVARQDFQERMAVAAESATAESELPEHNELPDDGASFAWTSS